MFILTKPTSVYGYLFFVESSNVINTTVSKKSNLSELTIFENAIIRVKSEILETKKSIDASLEVLWDILAFYELAIEDYVMILEIKSLIVKTHLTAESAINLYFDNYIQSLKSTDSYFQSRTHDFIDLKNRLIHALKNHQPMVSLNKRFKQPTILVFESVFPFELSQLDFTNIVGVISVNGSMHSHAAIILSSLAIPYMVMPMIKNQFHSYDLVQLDLTKNTLDLIDTLPNNIVTTDNVSIIEEDSIFQQIKIHPAINLETEIPKFIPRFWSSIGLIRTEFFFMNKNYFPDEIEQYLYYRDICQKVGGIRVLFRLIDVEIDKPLPLIEEKIYGIELLLKNRQLLRTQLTALLSVSKDFPIGITVPMIENQDHINQILNEINSITQKNEDKTRQLDYRFGVMIERKTALKTIQNLSGFDYILIGTNDLSAEYNQSLRNDQTMNQEAYLQQELQNDIKNLIKHTHMTKIETILCGDGANMLEVIRYYYEQGIRQFAPSIKNVSLYPMILSEIQNNIK